jgi:ParB family transcriptional regulator, chromosome partitioning protein
MSTQTTKLEFLTNQPSRITELPLSELRLGQYQPRRYFDTNAMHNLTQSIKQLGVLQPILVRPIDTSQYEIIAGERRYRASLNAGHKTIPAMIYPMSDQEAMELALVENLQRQDLTDIEELEGVLGVLAIQLEISKPEVIKLLYRMDNEQKGKVTQRELGNHKANTVQALFQHLGRMTWASFIAVRLPLLKLPDDLKEALRAAEITLAHARLLARVQNTFQRQEWTDQTIKQSLSTKQLLMQLRPNQKQQKHHTEITDLKARVGDLCKSFQKQNWNDPKKLFKAKKIIESLEALLNAEASG